MKRRNLIIVGVVVFIVAIVAVVYARSAASRRAEAEFRTQPAAYGDLTAIVGATGTVRANQTAVLVFETGGTVERVGVKVGDHVEAGDGLAFLQQTSLPASVILAEADLVAARRALEDLTQSGTEQARAQQALANAQDALEDAQYTWRVRQEGYRASSSAMETAIARLTIAEDQLERAKSMYSKVGGSPQEDPEKAAALTGVAEARAARDSAARTLNWYRGKPSPIEQAQLDADLATAEAALADAQREWDRLKDGPNPDDVAAAKARVAAAQATVDMARIAAPFAGTITSVDVKPGDQVTAGMVAIGLADLSAQFVDVDVSEIDINRIVVGQPVTFVLDAVQDKTYSGEVTDVSLAGTTSGTGVNFQVTARMADADDSVRPGMTAAVNVVVSEIKNVLIVPNRAIRAQNGDRVVYVLRDGMPIPVDVVLGASSDTDSQIVEGDIAAGDLVILNPPTMMFGGGMGGPPWAGGGS
jgi:HlyD family secretion protein